MIDRRVKVRELVEAISHSTVISVGHKKAIGKMGVAFAHYVMDKRDCVTISKQCLEMFQRNPDKFLRRFITMDETWIHYFTPETKEQSKQWTSPGEPAPKKAKTMKSARKATVFWMHAV